MPFPIKANNRGASRKKQIINHKIQRIMKKNLLTLAAALLVATSAWAQNSFTVNGLNYQETGVGTGKVKITGYTTRPTELVFPESLRTIGAHAFHYCQDLTSITCYNTTPPVTGTNAFGTTDKTIPVYVPANALSSYQNSVYWNEFTHITYITFISNNLEYKLLYTSPNQAEIIGYTTTPTGVLNIPATVNHNRQAC